MSSPRTGILSLIRFDLDGILVSAQVPLVLTLGLWTLGLRTWAWQLNRCKYTLFGAGLVTEILLWIVWCLSKAPMPCVTLTCIYCHLIIRESGQRQSYREHHGPGDLRSGTDHFGQSQPLIIWLIVLWHLETLFKVDLEPHWRKTRYLIAHI